MSTQGCHSSQAEKFPDFWAIFTDLKLAGWTINNTENYRSKLLFLQTSLKSIIFRDAFLIEYIIPWLFTDFNKLLRFSLTFDKIPGLFPDLEKFWFSLTVATLLHGKFQPRLKLHLPSWAEILLRLHCEFQSLFQKKFSIDAILFCCVYYHCACPSSHFNLCWNVASITLAFAAFQSGLKILARFQKPGQVCQPMHKPTPCKCHSFQEDFFQNPLGWNLPCNHLLTQFCQMAKILSLVCGPHKNMTNLW